MANPGKEYIVYKSWGGNVILNVAHVGVPTNRHFSFSGL